MGVPWPETVSGGGGQPGHTPKVSKIKIFYFKELFSSFRWVSKIFSKRKDFEYFYIRH